MSYVVCSFLLDLFFHLSLFSVVLLTLFVLWFVFWTVMRSSDPFLVRVVYQIVFFLVYYTSNKFAYYITIGFGGK